MAPPDTIWHKESLKLKEIFGTREGFEICQYQLFPGPIEAPSGRGQQKDVAQHQIRAWQVAKVYNDVAEQPH